MDNLAHIGSTLLLLLLALHSAPCWTQPASQPRRTRSSEQPPGRPAYPGEADKKGPAWYIDVAAQAGLRMLNVNGDAARSKPYILESTGSGVAIFDYDNDGWPDIFLLNGRTLQAHPDEQAPSSHLFHNNRDGTFTDVTAQAGLLGTAWAQGVCAGDYDNDGYDDLYVTAYGHNRLFHNQGNGTFREVAESAGVAGSGESWSTGCAFVDYDRDRKLDLVVSSYVRFRLDGVPQPGEASYCIWKGMPTFCGPRGLPASSNVLYHNLGNGKFEDVSKASGVTNTSGHYCFSISTLDYDNDGWPDIACDSTPSILYHNNRNGTFTDVAADAGVAFDENGHEQASMGSSIGDFDGDGKLDIFRTNFSDDTPTLYRNNGDGSFTDTTFRAGVAGNTQYLGWGTMFLDMDNDGWSDLLLANGHVYPEVDRSNSGSSYAEPRVLFRNLGNGKLQDISKSSGPGIIVPATSRGLAIGDLWNDGRLEAVINNIDDVPMLLVNVAKNANHWIAVRLIGKK